MSRRVGTWFAIASLVSSILVQGAVASTGSPGPEATAQATYTYEEAVALGIDVPPDPSTTGLPVCEEAPDWPGFATAEEAASVPDEPATCQADPTKILVSVGYPAPHAGYHWNGFRTTGLWSGGRINTEATNPSVDHSLPSGQTQFVVSRVLPQSSSTSNWIEAGWGEVSWLSGQKIYTFRSGTGNWIFYNQYNLTDGSYYPFRSYFCNNPASECAEIFWNNQWQLLDTDPNSCKVSGSNDCYVEEFVEIYVSHSTQTHPDLTAAPGGNTIHMNNTKLRTASGSWDPWTASSSEGSQTAYDTCHQNDYYTFYAIKGTCP